MSVGSAFWVGFSVLVLAMLALDLGVFNRKSREVTFTGALAWSGVWIGIAALFGGAVYVWMGAQRALEFAAGYFLEKSLSVDNLFVFVVVFGAFAVQPRLQHRVLYWGIIGALVMRGIFIALGVTLISRFHWVMYVFGGLLIITAFRLLIQNDQEEVDPRRSWAYRLFRRFIPSTEYYDEGRFLVRRNGKLLATPLLAVLVVIEISDVVFAVDSIPAIFAVTTDPFIVYSSNILAILGLRSLYFLLAKIIHRFHHLKLGLSVVLAFVGVKMLIMDVYKIPIAVSLAVISGVVALSIVGSLIWSRKEVATSDGLPSLMSPGLMTDLADPDNSPTVSGTRDKARTSWPDEQAL
jgi:tellurite resistance protein TerC